MANTAMWGEALDDSDHARAQGHEDTARMWEGIAEIASELH